MEQFDHSLELFIEGAGWLAPLLFIILHVIRPLLFLPVIVVCIAGGVLFGLIEGAILSFIGLTLMSIISYYLVEKFPSFRMGIARLKKRVFQDRTLTVSQVMILRIMPFVHFHLLSLYLMDMSTNFREYAYYSAIGVILPSFLYTAFGEAITELPWYGTLVLFSFLLGIYLITERVQRWRVEAN
ncbi:VTT domain-containing protein [Bacillaceae bacterium S4-13-58]